MAPGKMMLKDRPWAIFNSTILWNIAIVHERIQLSYVIFLVISLDHMLGYIYVQDFKKTLWSSQYTYMIVPWLMFNIIKMI